MMHQAMAFPCGAVFGCLEVAFIEVDTEIVLSQSRVILSFPPGVSFPKAF